MTITRDCRSYYGYSKKLTAGRANDGYNLLAYIKKNNYSEVFSECFDAYMRYGEEMKIVAPKTYEFYHNLVGEPEFNEIKVNGKLISQNNQEIIYGH